MFQVKFQNADGTIDEQAILYPDELRIIGEGHTFWGYTPHERFVIPLNGKLIIGPVDSEPATKNYAITEVVRLRQALTLLRADASIISERDRLSSHSIRECAAGMIKFIDTILCSKERVHILRAGYALCGFGMPKNWLEGHVWVTIHDVHEATCPTCIQIAKRTL